MSHIRIWWYSNHHIPKKKYSTIEIKEAVRIGHNEVLSQPDHSGEGRGVLFPIRATFIPTTTFKWFTYLYFANHSLSSIKIVI
jgi:hypothetical protein